MIPDYGFVSCPSRSLIATLSESNYQGPRLMHLTDIPRRPSAFFTGVSRRYEIQWASIRHSDVGRVTNHLDTLGTIN